jgi:mono/diheme cytochrome c family protein
LKYLGPHVMASACLLLVVGCTAEADLGVSLRFVEEGEELRTLTLGALIEQVGAEEWRAFDPYYEREKSWRTLPLHPVLEAGFGRPLSALAEVEFVLRAVDGYTVPISGARLLEAGAYIAYADVEVPEWEPIGTQKAHPGPFYLVWRGAEQQVLKDYPRPWQLAALEIAPFATLFPHTIPTGELEDSAAMRGFRVFKKQCLKCHAVNQEGGSVGPELNVPQSIVEYRPEAQIKAYIRDPSAFRYGGMPAHRHLSEAQLDELVAYFRAMSVRKHDPTGSDAPGAPPRGAVH